MKQFPIILLLLFSCSGKIGKHQNSNKAVRFTEAEVLEQLDLAFSNTPGKYYPPGRPEDIKYNFFPDLEHGYCVTAGSKIHLYADSTRWAIVFEKSGYFNRATSAQIELIYIGNCVNYEISKYPERNYISNLGNIYLIEPDEFERIENKDGAEMETFELIGKDVKEVMVRNKPVPFESDYKKYEKIGIKLRDYDNPKNLIGFGDLIRYLHETSPEVISATEDDISQHIPKDLPKIMTINDFYFVSVYSGAKPNTIETYNLLAKVLVSGDTTNWKPTKKPNNHWANWKSGTL